MVELSLISVFQLLCVVSIVSAALEGNQSCTTSGCNVYCGKKSFNLAKVLTTDNGYSQRVFTKDTTDLIYNFSIPLCGWLPWSQNDNYDYHDSHVWQLVRTTTNSTSFQSYHALGMYDNTSWTYGSYDHALALTTQFSNGQYCPQIQQNISSTVSLVCDNSYVAADPYVNVNETSLCSYSIQVYLSEICPVKKKAETPFYMLPGYLFLWCLIVAGIFFFCIIPGAHNNGGIFHCFRNRTHTNSDYLPTSTMRE